MYKKHAPTLRQKIEWSENKECMSLLYHMEFGKVTVFDICLDLLVKKRIITSRILYSRHINSLTLFAEGNINKLKYIKK